MMLSSCQKHNTDRAADFYVEPNIEVTDGRLTPEIMWKLGAVGSPAVSPDGTKLLFTISRTDIAEDKSVAELFVMPADGSSAPVRITKAEDGSVSEPAFVSNNRIAFLRNAKSRNSEGKLTLASQLFVADVDGANVKKLTSGEPGVDAFLFSPSGNNVVLVRSVKMDKDVHDLYPDLPKANARIETDLMYRHWNDWADGSFSHVFVAPVKGRSLGDEVDVMAGERHHSPLRPFGGIEQIAWAPDESQIAYTCKKLEGMASALSTNSDIYVYDLESQQTQNVSAPNGGYDQNPVFSADGASLFWMSMEHDGYESDRSRIFRRNIASGVNEDLTIGSELYVQQFVVAPDAKTLWFLADKDACDAIFSLDVESKRIAQLTHDTADYTSLALAADALVACRTSMHSPAEIYSVSLADGVARNISNVNSNTLAKLNMGTVEARWIPTTDGKKMLTWVVLPPNFDSSKSYPALLYCQGGPQSTVSQFWSRRWNFALMAANDYVVVAPNRRGLPGFGVEWNEQISKDYGGQNMKDYLAAIDAVAAEPYVDANRLGCVGASYGGFSVYWLAGHHQKRFKSFIAHCGIFNLDDLYATTEELFFVNWDLGGSFWDKSNAVAQRSFAQSPHLFVGEWDTPILVIHGEKDFRIPYTQGMAAFNVAKMRGLDAQFLYFPEECHWVSRPQNSILWHREFFRWLDKWLK